MLTVMFFVFVLYAMAIFISILPFWYETPNSPCRDIPAAPPGVLPVTRMWWAAMWAALLVILAHPLDLILRRFMAGKNQDGPAEYPPLLLVHGLYHNATGWFFFRRRLQKAGFSRIHRYTYDSWNTTITQVTNRMEETVADMEARYPGEKPILVGHSLGGVIIRNWLADRGNPERVRGALTLGAPHKGSKMAAFALRELGRTLLPSNPFFADLARRESPASIPCLSLASEADGMVLPQENLLPVTPGWNFRLTPYCTHVGLLTSPAVARMVAWELHRMAEADAARSAPRTAEDAAPAPPAESEQPAAEAEKPDAPAASPGTEPAPAESAAPGASAKKGKTAKPAEPKIAVKKTAAKSAAKPVPKREKTAAKKTTARAVKK